MFDELTPGGPVASRPLYFFWIIDSSGSMTGEKIQSLNYAITQTLPDMRRVADENPTARVMVRALQFSAGAQWMTGAPAELDKFTWSDVQAGGVTDLGKALDLLAAEMKIPPMPERALPPVLVLLSDGQPTDDYKKSLTNLLSIPWGMKSIRIAISIGRDADHDVLTEFTGNPEKVLQANNPQDLVKMIKWCSTAGLQTSSSPKTQTKDGSPLINMGSVPQPSNANDVW